MLQNLFKEGTHMGKRRRKKEEETEKRLKEQIYTIHTYIHFIQ